MLELRNLSRDAEELTRERIRLQNRMRDQLWRYYPQLLELSENVAENWIMDLWEAAPTPEKASRITRGRIERTLKRNRIRRINADRVREVLRGKSIAVAGGTEQAASQSIARIVQRLRLVVRQLKDVNAEIDRLLEAISGDPEGGGQRDAAILRSMPGVGRMVLATLLAKSLGSDQPTGSCSPTRLERIGAGNQAFRQGDYRGAPDGVAQPVAQRLPLHGGRGHPARWEEQAALRRLKGARRRALAGAAHGQRPPAGGGLRDAARSDPLRSRQRQGGGVDHAAEMGGVKGPQVVLA